MPDTGRIDARILGTAYLVWDRRLFLWVLPGFLEGEKNV